MLRSTVFRTSFLLIVLFGSLSLAGCAKPPQPIAEEPVPPQTSEAVPPAPQQQTASPSAPNLDQVQAAVKRVFKDSVAIDVSHKPCFLVGDFNGDESQDLAVILKPAEGKLPDLNQEFPNWIAREPLKEVLLRKSKALANRVMSQGVNPAAGQTVRFEERDVLLAIIHGSGPNGWRDPEATQTHLLRGVVGTNIRTLPLKQAIATYKGTKPFPTIYGDLIAETLIGQSGFIHFAGSIYRWYDPTNYAPNAGPAHPTMSKMR